MSYCCMFVVSHEARAAGVQQQVNALCQSEGKVFHVQKILGAENPGIFFLNLLCYCIVVV